MSNEPVDTTVNDAESINSTLKRKRSPSLSNAQPVAPAAKTAKTAANQLSINYLARSSKDDLPLANKEESLPNLLHLLGLYSNVLERHESLASNLGARPLGPILIKRFERCFEAAPKIVASHHKNAFNPEDAGHAITWLEVIEFARSHPSQFTLSTFSEGRRVCQFYLPQKQLRVQISEEDFIFINSGRCQELIPPLPIWEDEEKELSTCDVLEARLKELTNVADMVAARTRQLCHRLKGRKAAILERRAEGGSGTPAKAGIQQTTIAPAPAAGAFTAVNGRSGEDPAKSMATMRNDLLRHFESLPQNQPQHVTGRDNIRRTNDVPASQSPSTALPNDAGSPPEQASARTPQVSNNHRNSVAAPTKHNFSRPLPAAIESSQPFRLLCQAHMDSLPRGQRVLPPCDRCRRLRMDCVKNLTSCQGCTKKHARCHWKEVSRDELGALDHLMENGYPTSIPTGDDKEQDNQSNEYESEEDDDDDNDPLGDLEELGALTRREREREIDEQAHRKEQQVPDRTITDSSTDAPGTYNPGFTSNGSSLLNAFEASSSIGSFRPAHASIETNDSTRSSPDEDCITVARTSSAGGFRAVNRGFSHVDTVRGEVD